MLDPTLLELLRRNPPVMAPADATAIRANPVRNVREGSETPLTPVTPPVTPAVPDSSRLQKLIARRRAGPGMVDRATQFINRHEQFREQAYRDEVGNGQPWTVGYGRTGPDVDSTTTMTEPEARAWTTRRVRSDSARLHNAGVAPNEALLSFVYNAGHGALASTGALDAAQRGDWPAVARAIQRVNKGRDAEGNAILLPGLVRRRREEAAMLPTVAGSGVGWVPNLRASERP